MAVRDGLDAASTARYMDGQKLYYENRQPQKLATVVIDNSNPETPQLLS